MAACPSCKGPIPFHTIALAAFPVWLTCPRCRVRLVGGPLVATQTAVVLVAAAAVTAWACAALMGPPTLVSGARAVGLALLVVVPFAAGNVAVTMLWGRYRQR